MSNFVLKGEDGIDEIVYTSFWILNVCGVRKLVPVDDCTVDGRPNYQGIQNPFLANLEKGCILERYDTEPHIEIFLQQKGNKLFVWRSENGEKVGKSTCYNLEEYDNYSFLGI